MWLARGLLVATAGAALAGLGYSLVYPGLALKRFVRSSPNIVAWPWGSIPPSSISPWGWEVPRLAWWPGGVGSVFVVGALISLAAPRRNAPITTVSQSARWVHSAIRNERAKFNSSFFGAGAVCRAPRHDAPIKAQCTKISSGGPPRQDASGRPSTPGVVGCSWAAIPPCTGCSETELTDH